MERKLAKPECIIAYSNHDNSATVSKLTAQANRKAISEIASGGCPGAEWPVIV